MANVDEATWHEQAHVRGIALEYALMMFRADKLTKDNYLSEAGRYWEFLASGIVMPDQLEVPDDLSAYLTSDGLADVGLDIAFNDIPLPPEPEQD